MIFFYSFKISGILRFLPLNTQMNLLRMLFLGGNVPKIYQRSFRPKWSFVESIPGRSLSSKLVAAACTYSPLKQFIYMFGKSIS
jgi:hypothetical protein